ncbi:hypothetical protein CP533_3567 [Ophiocordyceps camponoti-saundersi (nom. inval.)]|nr:hypothetical protein CP533_3567 [Ophiocordyceps camponoti-saundersi (nom. inval.)]
MQQQRRWSAMFLALALCLLLWPSGISGAQPGGAGDASVPGGETGAVPGGADEAHPGEAGGSETQTAGQGAQPPPPTFVQAMERPEFVYVIVDGESGFTPVTFRTRGGILVEEEGFDTFVVDMAYGYETAESSVEESAYERVSRNVTDSMNTIYPSARGWWVYRIAASPNMVPTVFSYHSYSHMALGGIQWTQVHSFTVITEPYWESPDTLDWTDNEEYDPRWEQFGLNGRQPLLTGWAHATFTRRQLAVAFMNHLTSPQNTLLNEQQRQTLRELLDWNAEAEPNRDFPLLRRGSVASLTSLTLSQIDWDLVPIPPVLRLLLSGGLASLNSCVTAIRAFLHDQGSSPKRRRSEEDCERLAEISKDKFSVNVAYIEKPVGRGFCKSYHCAERGAKLAQALQKKKFKVQMCENEDLKPACVDVEAPSGECESLSRGGDCNGGTFELDPQEKTASLGGSGPLFPFNKKISSLRCQEAAEATAKHTPDVWTWSGEAQKSVCSEFDKLDVFFSLSPEFQAGTTDKLHLGFSNAVNMHTIKDSPSAGFFDWQTIDLQHVFGAPTVKVSSIRTLQLAATASWLSGLMGADEWKLAGEFDIMVCFFHPHSKPSTPGIRLHGRCAGSGILVSNEKFASFSPPKPLFVGDVFRRVRARTKCVVWEEFINLDDWVASPPCSHFSHLSTTLEMADEEYAGTTNDLYAVVNETKFRIFSSPKEREVRTIPIDLEQAYGSKTVKVEDVNRIGIVPLHGHHNKCLPKSLTLRAICAGKNGKSLEIERDIGRWLADGDRWSLDVHPDMWGVIQARV